MKIAIDYTPVEVAPAGIGQYTLNLCSELIQNDQNNSYYIYSTKPILLQNAQNVVIESNKSLPFKGLIWMRKIVKDLKKREIDILISPSNHSLALMFPRTIQFIHDLAPVVYPQFFSKKFAFLYKRTAKLVLKRAWRVATISETIRAELEQLAKPKNPITVIYPGVNKWINKNDLSNRDRILQKYNINDPYIFSLSTLEPRKNALNLIRAFGLYKAQHSTNLKLVLVGKKGWLYKSIFEEVENLKLNSEVLFLGYVPNQDLSALYMASKGFIFLSHYEGFGMPPLEALYLNVPTLLSDIKVFRECFNKLATFVDKDNPQLITKHIEQLLTNPHNDTHDKVVNMFNWESSAKKLLEIINERK